MGACHVSGHLEQVLQAEVQAQAQAQAAQAQAQARAQVSASIVWTRDSVLRRS
jgi:hypothetical protein